MTDKEKYNNLGSFVISSLSEEELKKAIHEWAEDDESMEKLLWACYNNGIETHGCHAGARPYLSLGAEGNINKLKAMLDPIKNQKGFSILISPDGGNPFSGDNFYKADMSIIFLKTEYKEEADALFDKMSDALNSDKDLNSHSFDPIIDLYNFFAQKESDLDFRLIKNDTSYDFYVELNGNLNKDYYNNLFTKAGLTLIEKDHFVCWQIKTNSIEELKEKLEYSKNIIIDNYDLELPQKIEDGMTFNQMFRILRRKSLEAHLNNEDEFVEWKNEYDEIFHNKFEESRTDKEKSRNFWMWHLEQLTTKEHEYDEQIKHM